MMFFVNLLSLAFVFSFGRATQTERSAPHPFYVSVTEISQNATDKSLEVSCKFFADDFEQTLETPRYLCGQGQGFF
jgi:hypothetical protein